MKVNIGNFPKDPKKERKISVKIDHWDTYNADHTLSLIIAPVLKQLREKKMGAPFVEDEDVPDHLKRGVPWDSTHFETDDKWFERWYYVLDEMIFAFESMLIDWDDQFWKREPEIDYAVVGDNTDNNTKPIKFKSYGEYDREGAIAYNNRMKNGFRLFGKYFEGLWT